MTNEKFNEIFNFMFVNADIKCEVPNEKKMDLVWKIIRNCLFSKPTKAPISLFNLLLSMYKSYSPKYKTDTQFILLVKAKCGNILLNKANEYATEDRLHNFNLAAEKLELPAEFFAITFMIKHIASIDDIVFKRIEMPQKKIDEKFIDAINYCILWQAINADDLIESAARI